MRWLAEWLWNFLPDKCEMDGCRRHGVRGNEQIVDGSVMCDDCCAIWMEAQRRQRKENEWKARQAIAQMKKINNHYE